MYREINKSFPAMGTVFSISLYDTDRYDTAKQIKEYTLSLENRWSVFKPDSEISILNQSSGKYTSHVSSETYNLLTEGIGIYKESFGAFDITAGALTSLWKKALTCGTIPKPSDIKKALPLVNSDNIRLDPKQNAISLSSCQSIDLGGIAKGYALDRAMELITDSGIRNALLNFGGTIGVIGTPVTIGIRDPFKPSGVPIGTLLLENRCAVTSGSYERFTKIKGITYHHIIDPRTGYPSVSGLCSVTLVGCNASMLDGLATGAMILGTEKVMPVLQQHQIEAIFVNTTGEVWITGGLEKTFKFGSGRKVA